MGTLRVAFFSLSSLFFLKKMVRKSSVERFYIIFSYYELVKVEGNKGKLANYYHQRRREQNEH